MISPSTFNTAVIWWILAGLIIFPFTLSITAPYGRHAKKGWGPMINNRAGWFIMEAIVLLMFVILVIAGTAHKSLLNWMFIGLFILHYIHRVFIFPFRIKTKGKKMPVSIMIMAICFNLINGSINGYWFGFFSPEYPISWLWDPRFIIGILLFFTGMIINLRSDQILLDLRKGGKTGYSIPYGGLFRFVSCPNFFGEILEWAGFAILTWCLPTVSFFVWTVVNLIPRALDHHRWYKTTFSDYPAERGALIPFVL